MTQETYLFHDSIAFNIGLGKPGASREEIVEAAQKASIHQWIQSLPMGMTRRWGSWGIPFPAVSVRESAWPGHFFMMPPFFC